MSGKKSTVWLTLWRKQMDCSGNYNLITGTTNFTAAA